MKITVQNDAPLLDILALLAPESSKNTHRSWVKEGRILIDSSPAQQTGTLVLKGQIVELTQRKRTIKPGIHVLYEDRDLVIVNKPAGLLSVATAFEKETTLHELLKAHYRSRKVCVVHRLDQETSGVMVFALNQPACERLKDIFEAHAIKRAYTAIVEGELPGSGTWESFQYEDKRYRVHETEDRNRGKLAITHYRSDAVSRRYSWLTLHLETGRKNQIRVHCASAGHPVVGDKKYGAKSNPVKRLCLHAHLLAFQHPFSRKHLDFHVPEPEEFYRLMPTQRP
jgi:tRNA pseudouridine32 synthase/23S rRNA pseudouridine746 synthase/23S rRNA pseudouridine1911/1915/1917 synthase